MVTDKTKDNYSSGKNRKGTIAIKTFTSINLASKQTNNRNRKISKRRVRSQRKMTSVKRNFAPVSKSTQIRQVDPYISSVRRNQRGNVSCRVSHREFITKISGSVAYGVNTFEVQPGLPATFPWLSGIAGNWENYQFRRLTFHYVTRSATSKAGVILMAPDYDCTDSAPLNYQTISSYHNSISDSVWSDFNCNLDTKSMEMVGTYRYVRAGVLGYNLDKKLYDVASFFVATEGEPDGTTIGELWVSYDIIFENPGVGLLAFKEGVSGGYYYDDNGFATTTLMGNGFPIRIGGNVQIYNTTGTNTVSFFGLVPSAWYMIVYRIVATSTITGTVTMTLVSGFLALNPLAQANNASTQQVAVWSGFATDYTGIMTMGGVTTLTGASYIEMWIVDYFSDPSLR